MINISFISQEKTLFEGQAEMVVMDGKEGQLGIVKGHSPLLAILKPGPVRMVTSGAEEVFFTEGGFAEVQPDSITILVDSAQRADDLDEAKILKAQNNIDDLIIDREPLEAKMIKLEAEVGPVKYIASLVVDWGITSEVDTSEAVRWVILIIIFVFDPLAVLLLVAANQSLIRKFPVEPIKPQEIVDLEKPDEEDVTLKWNEMYNKQDAVARMDKATAQLQEWKDKLEVKKEVEGDSTETDALAEEIKKLQETIAEDKKKVENK